MAAVDYCVVRRFPNDKYKLGDTITDVSGINPAHLARYCVPVQKGTYGAKPAATPEKKDNG